MYKRSVLHEGLGVRDRSHAQVLAQNAFYGGARSVLKVLAHMLEHGDTDEALRFIERQGRQLKALQGLAPTKHRH